MLSWLDKFGIAKKGGAMFMGEEIGGAVGEAVGLKFGFPGIGKTVGELIGAEIARRLLR